MSVTNGILLWPANVYNLLLILMQGVYFLPAAFMTDETNMWKISEHLRKCML